MIFWVWLHVVAIVAAMCMFIGSGLTIRLLAATGNASATRSAIAAAQPLFRIGGICAGVAIIIGLGMARNFGYGAPWLIGAYILTVIATVLGAGVDASWARRLAAADDATFPVVRADRIAAIAAVVGGLVWASLLWLMIAKPS